MILYLYVLIDPQLMYATLSTMFASTIRIVSVLFQQLQKHI